jgi:DNA-binding transcriptional regulator YhcF (GntR family)
MAYRISMQERAQVAARYEVWHSVVQVQRCWRTEHGPRATLDPKTTKKRHDKLMNTGSVFDIRRSGRPSKSRSEENVRMVQDMFTRSPQKSTRQVARESGLSRHTIRNVLKK